MYRHFLIRKYFCVFALMHFYSIAAEDRIDSKKVLDLDYLVPKLFNLYKDAIHNDKNIASRRFAMNGEEYLLHIQKLKEVGGFKTHNLRVEGHNTLRTPKTIIYINNPVEAHLPNSYLTVDEFKESIIRNKELQRNEIRKKYRMKFQNIYTKGKIYFTKFSIKNTMPSRTPKSFKFNKYTLKPAKNNSRFTLTTTPKTKTSSKQTRNTKDKKIASKLNGTEKDLKPKTKIRTTPTSKSIKNISDDIKTSKTTNSATANIDTEFINDHTSNSVTEISSDNGDNHSLQQHDSELPETSHNISYKITEVDDIAVTKTTNKGDETKYVSTNSITDTIETTPKITMMTTTKTKQKRPYVFAYDREEFLKQQQARQAIYK